MTQPQQTKARTAVLDLSAWATAFKATHASDGFGIITKDGREVARFAREADRDAAWHVCQVHYDLVETLKTTRRNIVSLCDAGLPGPLTEWLRVVDAALLLANPKPSGAET